MIVETFPVRPLGCNCSILGDETTREAIVVDPGGELEKIEGRLQALGLKLKTIVHTHTHIDHVGATAGLQRSSGATAKIHEADDFLYSILPIQAQLLRMGEAPERGEMEWLKDGEVLALGDAKLHVIHTPGHTPGSCCFELVGAGAADERLLFAGDTLFQGSIGRTDLWGGDSAQILKSIRGRLFTLPEPTRVVTGHGGETTIGDELRFNPFVGRRAK
jgi:glyoxylase-like metal-dependent hydrolase (beta-lactamase superfamily II)